MSQGWVSCVAQVILEGFRINDHIVRRLKDPPPQGLLYDLYGSPQN